MKHSTECLKRRQEVEKLRAEYIAAHPNYCRKCGGQGYKTTKENQAPIGSGYYWVEDIMEYCNDCLDQGRCPGCGEKAFTEEEVDKDLEYLCCSHCGWTIEKKLPEEYDCWGFCIE